MSYPELKPCPFCGSEACYGIPVEAGGAVGAEVSVWCLSCEFPWLLAGPMSEVAAAWNKRIGPEEAHAKIYNRVYDRVQRLPPEAVSSLGALSSIVFEIWRDELALSAEGRRK